MEGKRIEIGPFCIVQVNENMIKIYAEDYISINPSSGNTIIISSDKITNFILK